MLGYKRFNTVIMDGSSNFVNKEIAGIMDMVTGKRIGRTKVKSMDKNHPTMKRFTRFTSVQRYHDARRIIERTYPGLCVFDAKL